MAEVKKIATRDSYGNTLKELAAEGHDDLVVLDADLAAATKTGMFRKAYPDRFINAGIAEGNMMSVAAGMAAGGLYAGLVGVLKVKFGSNEVIATVMLNSIATYLVDYLLNGPMLAENSSVAQTERVLETAQLPRIFQQYQLTIAILLAVAACILVKLFMDRTALGYEIRAVGLNPDAAETAGISKAKVTIVALCISGCIAGLAGASHVLGVDRRLINGFSNDYGFSGISVAALAADSPVGVIFAGIVFGALRAGTMELNRTTSIPVEFVNVIQAMVVILVAAPLLVKELKRLNPAGWSRKTKKEVA